MNRLILSAGSYHAVLGGTGPDVSLILVSVEQEDGSPVHILGPESFEVLVLRTSPLAPQVLSLPLEIINFTPPAAGARPFYSLVVASPDPSDLSPAFPVLLGLTVSRIVFLPVDSGQEQFVPDLVAEGHTVVTRCVGAPPTVTATGG